MTDPRVPDLDDVRSPPQRDLDYSADLDIRRQIDAGRQASVFEALVTGADPPDRVAIRIPSDDPTFRGSISREDAVAFLDEAATWLEVDSRERTKAVWDSRDHVVGVVDTGDGLPWLALEYMDGGSLRDRLAGSPDGVELSHALWIGEQLCRGLDVAHTEGFVHLDLKPDNVLFRATPRGVWDVPKLADWGLGRALADESRPADSLSGRYSAPEQRYPRGVDADSYTDIYQLGAVVYALLTGTPPTSTHPDGDTPPPPSDHRPPLPRTVDEAVLTALEPRKRDRYDDVTRFAERLRRVRRDDDPSRTIGGRPQTRDDDRTDTDTTVERHSSSGRDRVHRNAESVNSDETSSDLLSAVATDDESSGVSVDERRPCPVYRGDLARTGTLDTREVSGPVTEAWRFETASRRISAPVVYDESVLFQSDTVYRLRAKTKSPVWTFDESSGGSSTPAIAGNHAFVGSRDNTVYALELNTGDCAWTFDTGLWVDSSPIVSGGRVYVGSEDARVYGLTVEAGEDPWKVKLDGGVGESSPAVADDTVVVGSTDGNVYAFDRSTSATVDGWPFETDFVICTTPAVSGNTVFVGSSQNRLYALDLDHGAHQWTYHTDGRVESAPAVTDDAVVFGCNDGRVYCLSPDEGSEHWVRPIGEGVTAPPTIVGSSVYVGAEDGNLYSLSLGNGSVGWRQYLGARVVTAPALVGGALFVGTTTGMHAVTE